MRELLDALQSATSRRSTWITSAAGGLLALAVGGIISNSQAPPPPPDAGAVCEGATSKLEGVWDDGTRDRVRAAFTATAQPFADSSFARVEQALDAWSEDFARVWSESCEAALGNDADLAETGCDACVAWTCG